MKRAGEGAESGRGALLETGAGFGELAFFLGLLPETQDFGVHIAFGAGIVPLPLHDPEPRGDVFRTCGDAVGEFPIEVAQAARHVLGFPSLQLVGAPELRQMGGSESRARRVGPKDGDKVRVRIPDAGVISRHGLLM